MTKAKTKRQLSKNNIIDPLYNLKTRSEELSDIGEYYQDLPQEAKDWLLDYTENYINASFDRNDESNNLINKKYTKKLIKLYLNKIKKNKADREVVDFVKKYLIRSDNVPIKTLCSIFFETEEKKILDLVNKFKDNIIQNIQNIKKRELNHIIKVMEREVYKLNNARNRDVFTREKAAGSLSYINDMEDGSMSYDMENAIITKIDLLNRSKKLDNSDDK